MFSYFTLDDFDLNGKVVGVRVDLNSPQFKGKIKLNERIIKSALTIDELSTRGAKVVLFAHQGREGKPDFVSLKEHKALLKKELRKEVSFIPDIDVKKTSKKLNSMKNGDILLLENLRFFDDEKDPKKKNNRILAHEDLFDYYVFDAFSVAHRKQTSIIGFTNIPKIAGRLMQKEIEGLNNLSKTLPPRVYVLGGAKPDDLLHLIRRGLELKIVHKIILTGVIGEIALKINGYDIGKKVLYLRKKKYLSCENELKKLLKKYKSKILIPSDVALYDGKRRIEIKVKDFDKNRNLLDKYEIQDIGKASIIDFKKTILNAKSIYFKGPQGNFELSQFQNGTKQMLSLITSSKAYTYMGGGHSVTSVKMFGYLDKFSYVSLAGGALVKYLSNEPLVGVDSLEKNYSQFKNQLVDYIVVGSNVIDYVVDAGIYFREFELGEKIRVKEDFALRLGGGGVNVSINLARLGARVGYLGKLSYDSLDFLKNKLRDEKVRIIDSKLTRKPIAKSILLDTKDKDRIIFTYRGQNQFLNIKDFDCCNFYANYFYFTSLQGESLKTQIKLAKKLRELKSNVKLCYNSSSALTKEKKLKELIKLSDILIINYDEAQDILGKEYDVSTCLKELHKLVREVIVITDGAVGSYAYDGKKEYFQKAVKPKRVEDSTGAGDAFGGTFFYFYSNEYPIEKAMKYAARNASSVVEKKGAQDGLLEYKKVIN